MITVKTDLLENVFHFWNDSVFVQTVTEAEINVITPNGSDAEIESNAKDVIPQPRLEE